jgi:hypothetical protein
MIKKQLIIIVALLGSIAVSAQDIVVNKTGQKFDCYISREDSSAVYFSFYRNEAKIDTFIVRTDLANYQYNASCDGPISGWDSKVCLSAGFGVSGSTFFGAEFEFLLSDRIGIQVGGGALGAGGGINYHFASSMRSSYLSLQYTVQGLSNNTKWGYKQTLIGPAIVFRGRSWLMAQVGVGYILDKGPAYNDIKSLPVALKVAIGGYLPL